MERNGLVEKFDTLLLAKETYWKQRSKIQWLKSGDPNTHFFHQRANYRKRKNWIEGLTNQHGSWESSDMGIENVVANYFSFIFQFNGCTPNSTDDLIEDINAKLMMIWIGPLFLNLQRRKFVLPYFKYICLIPQDLTEGLQCFLKNIDTLCEWMLPTLWYISYPPVACWRKSIIPM